ncbi:MAG TPA: hypothetical protein VGF69_11705 [Thermoanaerobaculia bacterium]|jgi:hypothetical protein
MRAACLALLVALGSGGSAFAQNTTPPPIPTPDPPAANVAATAPKADAQTVANTKKTGTSPWDFTFGPQEDGAFATTIKGSTYYPLAPTDPNSWPDSARRLFTPYVGVEADGGWSSAADATNNLTFSVRPAMAIQAITPGTKTLPPSTDGPWLFGFLDFRQRYGDFTGEDSDTTTRVNQSLLGAGVEYRFAKFPRRYHDFLEKSNRPIGKLVQAPSLSLAYYTERDTSVEDAELPEGIGDDVLSAVARAELTLPLQCKSETVAADPNDQNNIFGSGTKTTCPWALSVKFTTSWPFDSEDTNFQYLGDIALIYETGRELKPVFRYRSGTEHGLQVDRQIILGVLMRLFE